MKHLITLTIFAVLIAGGGAFLGKWTVPGLEKMPTFESFKEANAEQFANDGQPVMDRDMDSGRPPAYYSTGSASASDRRNRQLKGANKDMGVPE